jgi:Putative auto-transporter adhesin, head GIN domain
MKKLLIMALSSTILFSCNPSLRGSGKIISQKRNVGNFKGLSAATSIDVDVIIGSNYEVTVEADDNVIDYVKTEVVGGTLKVRYAENTSLRNATVTVHVTVPTLEKLSASSSANITVDGVLTNTQKIEFDASSSADIRATVDAPQIDADANSSARISLKGKTQNFKAEVSSSADIDAESLLSENTTAAASSSGTAHVHASVKLDGKANSSGTIKYRGGATVTKSESSSGSVEKE